MNLTNTLRRRVADTGARDPDSLHGILLMREAKIRPDSAMADILGVTSREFLAICAGAQSIHNERVPPVNGSTYETREPSLPGLFPRPWMRELISLMLRPDGVTTPDVDDLLDERGRMRGAGAAVSDVRSELRVFGISVEAKQTGDGFVHRYRIVGNDAWRMQKIIANGWAV